MTLSDLATKLEHLAEVLPIAAGRMKRNVALAILADLVRVTPADTGAAISNWQIANEPEVAVLPPYSPSPRGRMVAGLWQHAVDPSITTAANAPLALDAGKIIIEITPPGMPIFILNPLRYVPFLDQGSSRQAPAGFIDRASIVGKQMMDASRLLE